MVQNTIQRLQRDIEGFQRLSALLRDWTGIRLPLGQQGMILVTSRIGPILSRKGISSLQGYADLLRRLPKGHPDREAFVSALSTHTTSFFRESVHFDVLREVALQGGGTFKVWSAACSTGAEAYSMAMTLEEVRMATGRDYRILATDIAHDVLLEGIEGKISSSMAQQIPLRFRSRFWNRISDPTQEKDWSAAPAIRRNIRWARVNLVERRDYPRVESFDAIFCRNVLIYFDAPTAAIILDNLTASLKPGGFLILGHAESGVMPSTGFERLGSAVFRKPRHSAPKAELWRPESLAKHA